jgi:hypothetical protein
VKTWERPLKIKNSELESFSPPVTDIPGSPKTFGLMGFKRAGNVSDWRASSTKQRLPLYIQPHTANN